MRSRPVMSRMILSESHVIVNIPQLSGGREGGIVEGWRRDGGEMEEGWRRDGGGMKEEWRRDGGGMEEGCRRDGGGIGEVRIKK